MTSEIWAVELREKRRSGKTHFFVKYVALSLVPRRSAVRVVKLLPIVLTTCSMSGLALAQLSPRRRSKKKGPRNADKYHYSVLFIMKILPTVVVDLHGSTRRQGCHVGLEWQDSQAVGCGDRSGYAETRGPFRNSHLSSLLAGRQDGRVRLEELGLGLVKQLFTAAEVLQWRKRTQTSLYAF